MEGEQHEMEMKMNMVLKSKKLKDILGLEVCQGGMEKANFIVVASII